jgi:hypothetical protein
MAEKRQEQKSQYDHTADKKPIKAISKIVCKAFS